MIELYFPHIAGVSCSFAILAYVFKLFRKYRKIQVNCWFCNQNTKVEYKFVNSFVCPYCEQYNGFNEDGDYNCIIREQHIDPLKYSPGLRAQNYSTSKEDSKFKNGLCEACNLNQALKIRALAEFSAVSADDNDEVDKFKERLEEIYGLCQSCQATLRQTLGKQNSWLKPLLISWRLMKSKEKSFNIKSLERQKSSLWKLFYFSLLFVCTLLCLLSLDKYSSKNLQQYKKAFSITTAEINIVYNSLLWMGLALQSCIVFFVQAKIVKIKSILSYFGWTILLLAESENNILSEKIISQIKLPLNVLNLLFVFWICGKMFPSSLEKKKSPKKKLKKLVSVNSSYCGDSIINESISSPTRNNSYSATLNTFEEETDARKDDSFEDDLDATLLSLKISTPKKNNNADFSPQNLFKGTNKNSVLQPSKFGKHFITQSSWVAGGYWGSPGSPQRGRLTRQNVSHLEEVKPMPVFSLSRSSSQTSGFVSQFSDGASSKTHPNGMQNLPTRTTPSQQSSITGDPIDRVSLFSCGRNNSATSFGSLRPQATTDPFEAQTACSVSSYYSDNSQLRYRPSTRSGSCFHDSNKTNLSTDNAYSIVPYPTNTISTTTAANSSTNYFNLGIAFVLGLSVSANLFLFVLLWHNNDIFVK